MLRNRSSSVRALLAGALLAVAACSPSWAPPPPPPGAPSPPPPMDPPRRRPSAATSAKPGTIHEQFAMVRDRILYDWLQDDPGKGRELGMHELDGKVGEYTRE